MIRSIYFTVQDKKTDIFIVKVMIKILHCFFAQKLSILLSLLIGYWERHVCVCVRVCTVGHKRSLNKWNQVKIIEISENMGSVVLGMPSYK